MPSVTDQHTYALAEKLLSAPCDFAGCGLQPEYGGCANCGGTGRVTKSLAHFARHDLEVLIAQAEAELQERGYEERYGVQG